MPPGSHHLVSEARLGAINYTQGYQPPSLTYLNRNGLRRGEFMHPSASVGVFAGTRQNTANTGIFTAPFVTVRTPILSLHVLLHSTA